ncbi:MAG TPA: LamG-like jellyroll fold domain-containing protein [Chthoniobacteraceae bacterium]|nr:LamG-like jellyroll fold domain-containing protein [Chthoniobacteraceae bacterium]
MIKKLKFSSRIARSALLVLVLSGRLAAAEPFFEWFGEGELPGDPATLPQVVEGDLGTLRELQFKAGDENPGEATFIAIQPPAGSYTELTIAFFIKPERRNKNENLVSARGETDAEGFSLRKTWMKWGLIVGRADAGEKRINQNRETSLAIGEWRHIALTFREGKLRFYKDGFLTEEQESPVPALTFSDREPMRIGAGHGVFPRVYYGFAGRLAGIYIAPKALEETEIHGLMKRANP